jgi:hypothetical protein
MSGLLFAAADQFRMRRLQGKCAVFGRGGRAGAIRTRRRGHTMSGLLFAADQFRMRRLQGSVLSSGEAVAPAPSEPDDEDIP